MLKECLYSKVGEGGAEKYGRQFSLVDQILVKFRTGTIQQFDLFQKLFLLFCIQHLIKARFVNADLFLNPLFCTFHGIGEGEYLPGISVIHTSELLAGTNGPVDGAGGNSQLLLNVVQQIKGIVCIPIQLVDKGKNRDMTHGTDFEQLSGLCLHTF